VLSNAHSAATLAAASGASQAVCSQVSIDSDVEDDRVVTVVHAASGPSAGPAPVTPATTSTPNPAVLRATPEHGPSATPLMPAPTAVPGPSSSLPLGADPEAASQAASGDVASFGSAETPEAKRRKVNTSEGIAGDVEREPSGSPLLLSSDVSSNRVGSPSTPSGDTASQRSRSAQSAQGDTGDLASRLTPANTPARGTSALGLSFSSSSIP
jgi:hypothetical protein